MWLHVLKRFERVSSLDDIFYPSLHDCISIEGIGIFLRSNLEEKRMWIEWDIIVEITQYTRNVYCTISGSLCGYIPGVV